MLLRLDRDCVLAVRRSQRPCRNFVSVCIDDLVRNFSIIGSSVFAELRSKTEICVCAGLRFVSRNALRQVDFRVFRLRLPYCVVGRITGE